MADILRQNNFDVEKLEMALEHLEDGTSSRIDMPISARLLPSIQEEESNILDSGRSSLLPMIQSKAEQEFLQQKLVEYQNYIAQLES